MTFIRNLMWLPYMFVALFVILVAGDDARRECDRDERGE